MKIIMTQDKMKNKSKEIITFRECSEQIRKWKESIDMIDITLEEGHLNVYERIE